MQNKNKHEGQEQYLTWMFNAKFETVLSLKILSKLVFLFFSFMFVLIH